MNTTTKKETSQSDIKTSLNKRHSLLGNDSGNGKWQWYASLALIALFSCLAMWNSIYNGFVNYDDNIYIYENPAIRNFSIHGLMTFFSGNVGQYPPLVMIIYTTLHYYFKLDPLPYHTVNLALHVLNSLLVFLFIYNFDKRLIAALVAGLLFGVHPLHVESVAWATELKDVLYTFFFLLGLLAYQRYQLPFAKRKYLIFALLLFILSCFSKGMAVVFPLILLLMDYFKTQKISRKQLKEKIPFFVVAIAWGLITFITQQSMGATSSSDSISWFQRFFIASYGALFYIRKMFLPTELTAFYAFPINAGGSLPLIFYITPLIILVLCAAVYFSGKYRKALSFGLLFYIVNLLLVLQIIPVGMAVTADRYFYLSSVGLFFLAGFTIDTILEIKPKLKSSVLSAFVMITALLAVSTHTQVKTWENSISLWNNVVKDAGSFPGYALAFTNRGDARSDEQDFDGAIQDYNTAIRLNPMYIDAYNNRGLIKGLHRDYLGAKQDFDEAIRIRPDYAKAYNNRGNANRYLGDLAGALNDFNMAISIKPTYMDAYLNRGIIQYLSGNDMAACGDWMKVQQSGSKAADQLLNDYCKK